MSTPLERQLAEALKEVMQAEGSWVAHENCQCRRCVATKKAIEALAEYEEQNRPRVNY